VLLHGLMERVQDSRRSYRTTTQHISLPSGVYWPFKSPSIAHDDLSVRILGAISYLGMHSVRRLTFMGIVTVAQLSPLSQTCVFERNDTGLVATCILVMASKTTEFPQTPRPFIHIACIQSYSTVQYYDRGSASVMRPSSPSAPIL
jgi:hypothetical protein